MFESFDAILLARIQFAFTVSFHIIFPAFSIGLASYLAVLEALWLWKKDQVYMDLFNFWKTIFAVAFGMGVVSGIVMSYQFGTNWSVFSDKAGPVIGPLMGYEVLTAFFLEAGFLGVMLFGLHRVGPKLHFLATFMVAFGTLISATWILAVNSWMQTPAGFGINEAGQFIPLDWWKVIFNPSFPYRLLHMVLAAYLTTAFVVGAVGAWHLLKNTAPRRSRTMFSMAMWMAAIVAPIQILAGDFHGLNTLEHQPAKVMAMEGHYQSHPDGAPLILFGLPNSAEKRVDYAIEIPKLSSLILKHDLYAPLAGLDTIPEDRQPPVAVVFWSFRVMVAIGFAMLGIGLWSLWCRYRGTLESNDWLHRAAVAMGPAGFVAVLAGWITTEVGRQPYTIYGHLLTADSISPVAAPAVAASLIAFIIVYFLVFGAGTFYILRLMKRLPRDPMPDLDEGPIRTAGITPAPPPDMHTGAPIMAIDLPFIWAAIIAFAVLAYVILDGFDLGIGILFPFFPEKRDRDVMMNSVAPVWDGNETWLVLGGGGLLAVFPLAYAIILPALYAPIIAMLLGLIFRGVAFEYRWRTKRGEFLWNWAFAGGSALAAFSQGIALGALVQGIPVVNRAYAGAWWDWLTPFSIATGFAVLVGYALLGSTWLIAKTTGALAEKARRIALRTCFATIAAMGIVSLWTPFLKPQYLERWFGWPTAIFSVIVPLLVLGCFALLFTGIRGKSDTRPFIASLGLFVLGYAGIGISFYPFMVPPSVTIWDAAAPDSSLSFLLVGALVLVPIILAYTVYAYWVFRGKVDPEEGYH